MRGGRREPALRLEGILARGVASALLLSQSLACGTLAHGRVQKIEIVSEPTGATARFEPAGIEVTTPDVVELPRKRGQLVTLEHEGHEPRAHQINTQISGWFFVNLFLGGLIGMTVDLITGGAYNLEPERVEVELEPVFIEERTP